MIADDIVVQLEQVSNKVIINLFKMNIFHYRHNTDKSQK